MRIAHPATWENLYAAAGAQGVLLLEFKNPKLKPLTGKSSGRGRKDARRLARRMRPLTWSSRTAAALASPTS